MPPRTLELRAHAKINLALAVGPPIAEGPGLGLHPIASWMHAIDLHDRVALTRLEPGSPSAFETTWADGSAVGWPVESDLVFRAHGALEVIAGPLPARIVVRKSIPAGGGLGGGSSDAAAVLRGLDWLFGLGIGHARLAALAHELGSDIPFFIDEAIEPGEPPRPALVTGLGDRIDRLGGVSLGEWACLLICPPFGCPTGAVYRAFDARPDPGPFRAGEVERVSGAAVLDPSSLFNDLATPAETVEPRLGALRRGLESRLGRPVHVSGSGSTLFVFLPADECDRAGQSAENLEPGSIVIPVSPTYVHV
ncbi:MAG: hypothetical protein H6810_04970 [Phycisphaeraceae bacterium]|nr:MAG: hypothetical protein H6810_04970 [Phycisphaeraceae bacterium]